MALQPHPSTTIQVEESEDGYDCCCCFDNPKFKKLLKGLFYGQVLSLCLCGTGIGSQKLSEYKVNTPMAQSFLNYFFLAFVYGIALLFRNGSESIYDILRKRGLKYVLLAVIDVEANYLVVWSYQYTNLTSVQLLDCATIPFVMILSFFMLRVRYLTIHIIGVAFSLIGICFVIWSDAIQSSGPSTDAPNKYLGDFLCIASSALYACSNTGEEKLIKQHSRSEYLGLVGIFGSIIAGLQLALFEREKLEEVKWDWTVISWYLLYSVSMFIFYSLVSIVMQKTSALMFNLSILTADFYSLIAGIYLFKYQFHWLYFVSFAVVITGSIIYSIKPTRIAAKTNGFETCITPLTQIVSNFGACHCLKQETTPSHRVSRQQDGEVVGESVGSTSTS